MRFDSKAFGWLNDDGHYPVGWSNISREELQMHIDYLLAQGIVREDAPDVFDSVEVLKGFLDSIGLTDLNCPVLGLKIDDGGVVEQVNGPAFFATEDGEIVLKVGDTKIPATVKGTKVTVNKFSDDIVVSEHGEDPNKFRTVACEHYVDLISDNIEIPFVLDTKERPEIKDLSKGKLKKTVTDGQLASLLRRVPDGESFVKPRDLDVGEYSVAAIEENKVHEEYGRSWKITLVGVGAMMSTGRLNNTLERGAAMYKKWLGMGKPLTFSISKKEEMAQGVRVDCGFFKREPNPAKLGAVARVIQQVEEEVTPALPPAPTTVDVVAAPAPVEQPMLDEIPF